MIIRAYVLLTEIIKKKHHEHITWEYQNEM